MEKDTTRLVFILDRSGSMSGLEMETIRGYNDMLRSQKEKSGLAFITTVLFDDKYEILHDDVQIQDAASITGNEYYVRGSTALLDAVGRTIINITEKIRSENDHVIFVIITDGMENASREFNQRKIHSMIEHQKKSHGWEFIFLGANIDAVAVAESIGIEEECAANFNADPDGIELNFEVLNETVSEYRTSKSINKQWKSGIEKDFNKREHKK